MTGQASVQAPHNDDASEDLGKVDCFHFFFSRLRSPCRCIKQLESFDTRYSAPVSNAEANLDSPIAVEIIGNFTQKVPPKPQQVV